MTTVYTTRGSRVFHQTPTCRARTQGQNLNDWDFCCGDYCTHRAPRLWAVQETDLDNAIAAGKKPCGTCYGTPGQRHTTLPPSTEDFGHRPFEYDGVPICTRCYTTEARCSIDAFEVPRQATVRLPVLWPCTSAIVLGLAPRPQETTP